MKYWKAKIVNSFDALNSHICDGYVCNDCTSCLGKEALGAQVCLVASSIVG